MTDVLDCILERVKNATDADLRRWQAVDQTALDEGCYSNQYQQILERLNQ